MKPPITEYEAHHLLQREGRRARARAVLAKRSASTTAGLVSAVVTGICLYAMGDFAAPLSVKVLITVAVTGAIVSQVECWQLQRRLDAAIELLRQADGGHG